MIKKWYLISAFSILSLITTTAHAEWYLFKKEDDKEKIDARKAVIATALIISGGAITLKILDLVGYTKAGGLPRALSLLALTMVDAVTDADMYGPMHLYMHQHIRTPRCLYRHTHTLYITNNPEFYIIDHNVKSD